MNYKMAHLQILKLNYSKSLPKRVNLFTNELKEQSALAVALTGLIAMYWVGKVATQIAYYPMYQIPQKTIFKIGSYGMNTLFVLFAVVNTLLFIHNLIGHYKL